MADTGWQFAGTGANVTAAPFNGGGSAWTNPGNITADDNSNATNSETGDAFSQGLASTNHGSAIPSGATIDGIQYRYRRWVDDGEAEGAQDHNEQYLRLILSDSSISTTDRANITDDWGGTEEVVTRGGATDLWGETQDETDLNNSNSGFAMSDINNDSGNAGGWPHLPRVDSTERKVFYTEGAGATLEQEGFAFGDDDGSESAHTLDTQDTNITAALGTKTLRLLANATDDPASTAYKLKYQKNGSGGYTDVPLVSSESGVAGPIEAGDVTQDGSNTTSATLVFDHPAYVVGDLLIFNLSVWHYDTTVTIPAGPNGETGVAINNAAIASSGVNSPNAIAFYYIGTGTQAAGSISITANQTTRWDGGCVKVLAGEFDPTDPIGSVTGTDFSVTDDTNPEIGAFTAASDDGGGKLIALVAVDQDPISGTPTGWTDILDTDQGRASIVISVRDADVTDSESVTGDGGWTITNDAWVTLAYIVRPSADVTNEVYISASGNVAAGGEATTARLIAPATKTTGDSDTGRRWDDENGSDPINITLDNYTELEWVQTIQVATNPDYFEFRLYKGDTVFDTYTVTPRWTIAAAGGATGKSNPLFGPLGGPLVGPIG